MGTLPLFIFQDATGAEVHGCGAPVASFSTATPKSDRWFDVTLVKSFDGGWLLQKVGRSRVEGEEDRFAVIAADTDEDLIAQLGQDRLAHAVYERAGIRNIEWID